MPKRLQPVLTPTAFSALILASHRRRNSKPDLLQCGRIEPRVAFALDLQARRAYAVLNLNCHDAID